MKGSDKLSLGKAGALAWAAGVFCRGLNAGPEANRLAEALIAGGTAATEAAIAPPLPAAGLEVLGAVDCRRFSPMSAFLGAPCACGMGAASHTAAAIEAGKFFVCASCRRVVGYCTGGSDCASDAHDSETCPHEPKCSDICAECWCDRSRLVNGPLPPFPAEMVSQPPGLEVKS